MADLDLLKTLRYDGEMTIIGTLRWNRQPVLSILRGVESHGNLVVERDPIQSSNPSRAALHYKVSREGVRVGTVRITVGPRSVSVQAESVHDPERPVHWDWNGRALGKSRSWDGKVMWSVKPRPRPKFRRFGLRIRKTLLELDNPACVERVMES